MTAPTEEQRTERSLPARRLMLVHAHPDDETINNGATMARYVDEGAAVTLVTCTLGEEGEVLVDDLAHLAAEHSDELGDHRLAELKQAMDVLGVTDHVRLGGDGRYRDSGMVWNERGLAAPRDALRPGTLWTTDLLELANELVPLIRDRRPQVLITYDEIGMYGHPDHIQAHRVATYGAHLAGVRDYRRDLGEPWSVDRILWAALSRSRARTMAQQLRDAGIEAEWNPEASPFPMYDDAEIHARIDGRPWVGRKIEALLAHATQIRPDGNFFTHADVLGEDRFAAEYYRLAAGVAFPGPGWADDLFAGLD